MINALTVLGNVKIGLWCLVFLAEGAVSHRKGSYTDLQSLISIFSVQQ